MLDKLPKAYAPFISAIDKDWLDYIYANLRNIIHQITWYLKNNPLKILCTASITCHSIEAYSNKRQQVTLTSSPAPDICK